MSKTTKDLQTEKDRTWRTKGVPHKEKDFVPIPCPHCLGFGYIDDEVCEHCMGTGEDYE
jgi:DnaJ-class molecular chaperone